MPSGRSPGILFVDLSPAPCVALGCSDSLKAIQASVANVEVLPSTDLSAMRDRRRELLLLRATSERELLENIRPVRAVCPGVSCFAILCCEEVDPQELHVCFAAGLDDFVCCPFREAVLVARLARLLARHESNAETAEEEPLFFGSLVAVSPGLCKLLSMVPLMARSNATVLITGETGTGKELVARAIHYQSPRKSRPFVPVNCGALPDHLFENELFGHARGAYTDAFRSENGLLAECEGGTLFLDEIDALSASAQAKILRLLENGEYRPLGSAKIRYADVRIVAATNADLRRLLAARAFREDLYHRLNVLTVHIPPLRERIEDIPALVRHFLSKYGTESLYGSVTLTEAALRKLMSHHWPGNVRELERTIQRTAILAPAPVLEPDQLDLPASGSAESLAGESFQAAKRQAVEGFERCYLAELMAQYAGNVSRAARAARKERRSFQRLLRKHGLDSRALGVRQNGPRD